MFLCNDTNTEEWKEKIFQQYWAMNHAYAAMWLDSTKTVDDYAALYGITVGKNDTMRKTIKDIIDMFISIIKKTTIQAASKWREHLLCSLHHCEICPIELKNDIATYYSSEAAKIENLFHEEDLVEVFWRPDKTWHPATIVYLDNAQQQVVVRFHGWNELNGIFTISDVRGRVNSCSHNLNQVGS